MKAPRIFLSYSHDSAEHRKWVTNLASRLVKNGVEVILDQWDLALGEDLAKFMERAVSAADRVLLVCTEQYVTKADSSKGGVGYETMIVSGELLLDLGGHKFIPLVRQAKKPVLPRCLATRCFIDFSEPEQFETKLEELLRELHSVRALSKPQLGVQPFSADPKDLATGEQPSQEMRFPGSMRSEQLPDVSIVRELGLLEFAPRCPAVRTISRDQHITDIARLANAAFGDGAMSEDQIRELHGSSKETIFILQDCDGNTRGFAAVMALTSDVWDALRRGTSDPGQWDRSHLVVGPDRWRNRTIYVESSVVSPGPTQGLWFTLLLSGTLRHINAQLREAGIADEELLYISSFAFSSSGRAILTNLLHLEHEMDASRHKACMSLYCGALTLGQLFQLQSRVERAERSLIEKRWLTQR